MGYIIKIKGACIIMATTSDNNNNHYLDKVEFSKRVLEFSKLTRYANVKPRIPNHLGIAILELCTRLANRPNFNAYTYRDEMIMDAVENCIKVLNKGQFNENAETKNGELNAFGYFTMIAFRAMVRRIKKENTEHKNRLQYIEKLGLEDLIDFGEENGGEQLINSFIDDLKDDMYFSQIHRRVNEEFCREKLEYIKETFENIDNDYD